MSKLKRIESLRETLNELKEIMIDLEQDVSELQRLCFAGHFIPETLNHTVREKLQKISSIQTTCMTYCENLEFGQFPEKVQDLEQIVEIIHTEIEKKEIYIKAIQFFLQLHSSKEETEHILIKRKQALSNLNIEALDIEQLKEQVESYVWLYQAYYETEPQKKFLLIYQMSSCFEVEIAMEIQFGTLFVGDSFVSEEVENKELQESENAVITQEQEVEAKIEIIEETEEVVLSDTVELEEVELVASELEPKVEETVWEQLKIENPDSLLVREDNQHLQVELSAKANNKFSVKEFKKDILKQIPDDKIDCCIEALESCGYTLQSIALWNFKQNNYYELATEKLFQLGYLKKYTVLHMGTFFTLSERGEKAFISKDSTVFINTLSKQRTYRFLEKGQVNHIEDKVTSAMVRLLNFNAYDKVLRMSPTYRFRAKKSLLGTEYFLLRFIQVSEEQDALFVGILSENPEEFKEFTNHLKKEYQDEDWLVVIGITAEQAKLTAKWVELLLAEQSKDMTIGYCGYKDTEIKHLKTDTPMNIASDKTNEDAKESEAVSFKEDNIEDEAIEREEVAVTEEDTIIEETEEEDGKTEKFAIKEVTYLPEESVEEMIEEQEELETLQSQEQEPLQETEYPSDSDIVYVQEELTQEQHNYYYQGMLAKEQYYGALLYVKFLSKTILTYESVYRQLAYALNDPMENCSYNSDTLFGIYYDEGTLVSDYYVVSAAIRNYFMDQYSYDYSLPQLQSLLAGNPVLRENPTLNQIVYMLQTFKTEQHSGIDKYADYRKKERAILEQKLQKLRQEAKGYYENFSTGSLKETTSNRRFIETEKLLLGQGSDLSQYLEIVIQDDRSMVEALADFLAQNYVKDEMVICEENLDSFKINQALELYWNLAANNMRQIKKTSDLMSSLRMSLFKKVSKIAGVLCNYVFLVKSIDISEDDAGLYAYNKIRNTLVLHIEKVLDGIQTAMPNVELFVQAGYSVIMATLRELKERITGTYKEGIHKFFYMNFLKNDKIILGENYLPVLDEILELPELSGAFRVLQHCKEPEVSFQERLQDIFSGGDDYGSAILILEYLKFQEDMTKELEDLYYNFEKAIVNPKQDMENKRKSFVEDLELAQSYGQIDNTIENSKETMNQIMDIWYLWAMETRNYGFFVKILSAFKNKIKRDAQVRAIALHQSLDVYLRENTDWNTDKLICQAVHQIQERIAQQNYAAAEDLLNRLMANDLDLEVDFHQTDYLMQFLEEYENNYRKIANPSLTLKSLVTSAKINKDTKGASRLLESWPKGAGVGEKTIRSLMNALGFQTDVVKVEAPIQGKIENYFVTLERPQNGRRSNYKHPIAAFGSEAEEKGFRVVCLFGKSDAGRLVDTFKEIGNAKNTLVLLDYALTLADRRILARKTKTDLFGKTFAVIDRVVLVYLAKQYTETTVNRMLMSVIMPFASYQPYIDKSADVMPQELFIGRKSELEKIESPTGVNIVYGGRQLGKTALLRMAKKSVDKNENGDRAVIVNVWKKDYRETAKEISMILYDENILKEEHITEDWDELVRDIKNRLRDTVDPIPYFLLMIDEADTFIESCEEVDYQPFNALKTIQSIGTGRFKFVIAGLRNMVRFKKKATLGNNGILTHLDSLTIKPFKAMEARELLEVPLSYLGFRFPKDNETEVLISTIFGTTNYFPGLIQLYCIKLIEAMRRDYAGYAESETPPYVIQKEHIKKVLAEQSLQQDIHEKFFITLKVDEDDYYYIIALLLAYHYHNNKEQNGCNVIELIQLADMLGIGKIAVMEEEKLSALLEEMRELNIVQHTGDGRYRFARHSFCQMMGTFKQIEDELWKYME